MIHSKREPKLDAKLEAFSFQQKAVVAIQDLPYAAVFHEQGLGKTKIGIDIILHWLKTAAVDSAIIVTKRSLIENWRNELNDHTFVTPRILSQDRLANFNAFNSPARIYLTHYEAVLAEEKRLNLFFKTRTIGILLDEAQKIKNPAASLSQAFHRLATHVARKIVMTGTPVANRPYDIWSQIFFLDSGKALGVDFEQFKIELDLTNDMHRNKIKQVEFKNAVMRVQGKISEFSVRETKQSSGIELPGKTYENVVCELEERQAEIYDSYKRELGANVYSDGFPTFDKAEEVLKRLLRLVQVASNPNLVDDSYKREPGKFSYLTRIVENAVDAEEKIIVWTSFVQNADWLVRRLAAYGCVGIHGGVAIDDRNRRIAKFKNDKGTKILVATPGAAKEGLTLTVANHAVFYDRSFSLDDYLQAQDRIHRISQTKNCIIYNLVGAGTVDEWVDVLIEAKSSAASLLQADISEHEFDRRMSYDFGAMIQHVLNADHGPD